MLKRYSPLFLGLIVGSICLFVVAVNVLPDIWFKRLLNKNYNIHKTDNQSKQLSTKANRLCLIFALDGVPYDVMSELHEEGYFKGFYKPGRLISTFPSLTRPAFSRMLIGGKPFGYERLYFDVEENHVKGFNLVRKLFVTKKVPSDYHPKLNYLGFPGYIAYVFPDQFTKIAMETFKKRIVEYDGNEFIAYMGLSDAISHVRGREAQKDFLKKISLLLDETRNELGVSLDVVAFSDHGNNHVRNHRVNLASALVKEGFRDVKMLTTVKDFVLLRNGFVSVAAIYTHPDSAGAVSTVISGIEGVDFSVYLSGQSIIIRGHAGVAKISRRGDHYQYTANEGDPLKLVAITHDLMQAGRSDKHGFFRAQDWWEATKHHVYPDPLRRIWEGLHDLVQHPATLLVSFKNGYAFGPAIFDQNIIKGREGTHGALLDTHSNGFLMTDFMSVNLYNPPRIISGLLAGAAEAKQNGQKQKLP